MDELDLYPLIRRYCNSYQISDFRFELFLHDSTPIEYIVMDIAEVERLISIMNTYWSYFSYLIANLSFEEERGATEPKNKIVGNIDFPKTNLLRLNRQSGSIIVCTSINKNIFTPENILLASVRSIINLLAREFLRRGIEKDIDEFKSEHEIYLNKIIDYLQFLLKDRPLKKLADYYLLYFGNYEGLIAAINQRSYDAKLKNRYFNLIQFVKEWKNLLWILNEQRSPFRKALTAHLEKVNENKIYEMWIFYKTLSLFGRIYQKRDHRTFVNKKTNFSVLYNQQMGLGWFIENQGKTHEVFRRPDIVIKKKGVDVAIIDAKCKQYSEKSADDQQDPEPEETM